MPGDNGVAAKVSGAKAALDHANKAFPSSMAPASSKPKPTVVSTKPATAPAKTNLGAELGAKADNVNQYVSSLPKMHSGGPVMADGAYQLKAGEHVLTEAEAKMARKHAIMATGMKSLAKAGPNAKPAGKTSGEPEMMKKSDSKPSVKVVTRTAEKK